MKRLILLAYQDRSGSTYLAKKISEEFKVFVTKEAEFPDGLQYPIPKSIDTSSKMIDVMKKSKLKHWEIDWAKLSKSNSILNNPLGSVLDSMEIEEDVVIFKRGRSIFYYDTFNSVFDSVDVLVIRRDPEPVWLSQNSNLRSRDKQIMEKRLRNFIRREFRFVQTLKSMPQNGVNLKIIRYDKLISDWNGVKEELHHWLGVPYRNSNVSYEVPYEQAHLHPLIGSDPNKERLSAWRNEISNLDHAIIEKCIRGETSIQLTSTKEVLKYQYEVFLWKIWKAATYVRSNFF